MKNKLHRFWIALTQKACYRLVYKTEYGKYLGVIYHTKIEAETAVLGFLKSNPENIHAIVEDWGFWQKLYWMKE